MKKFFLFLCIVYTSPALALTCLNDYSGTDGCAANANAAGDCGTLGYSQNEVDGCTQYLYCPFDTSFKRCVSSNDSVSTDCTALGFTSSNKSGWCKSIIQCPDNASLTLCAEGLTCDSDEVLINWQCKQVYSSCDAAHYYDPSLCTAGYNCSGDVIIYTSVDGTSKNCYKNYYKKLCNKGYATSADKCTSTPDGSTCGSYELSTLRDAEPSHYSGEEGCWPCSCGLQAIECIGSKSCPTGGTCSSCTDASGNTLYTLTGCNTGFRYVENGNYCYDCVGMQTKLNNALGKGSYTNKHYIQACDSNNCESDTFDCGGDDGYRAWDSPCVCSIIGSTYCLNFDAGIEEDDGEVTEYCTITEEGNCKSAMSRLQQVIKEHNNLCPNNKVEKKLYYTCDAYIPASDNGINLSICSMNTI